MAGFSAAFGAYAPKTYDFYRKTMSQLTERHPELQWNFDNSVFPTMTFNMGPDTTCLDHNDCTNVPQGFCSVTALGDFNPDEGGYFYLWDLRLAIRFPPGSTILIPSSSLRHGTTPIQTGESRYSITQYCPGGLVRWVRFGFRRALEISKEERRSIDGSPEVRWAQALDMLSKYKELEQDRKILI